MHPDASEQPARGPGPNASDLSWQRASPFSLEPGHRPPAPTTTSCRSTTRRLPGRACGATAPTSATTGSILPVTPSLAVSPPASASGASQACPQAASAGDSIPFVDPALTAPEAPIHWLTEPGTPTLHALARKAPSAALADVALVDFPCIRQVVIGPDHVEHLLIRNSNRSLTIRLTGHRASQGPVCLTFHVPARSAKDTAARLAWYPDLLAMKPRWIKRTRRQLLVRDALIAVDGRDAGASHREVAEVSVGRKRVREEWSARGGWLKERMRRALAVGEALCDGGHWKYIERACRFAS